MRNTDKDEIVINPGELVRVDSHGAVIHAERLKEVCECQRCGSTRLMYLRAYDFCCSVTTVRWARRFPDRCAGGEESDPLSGASDQYMPPFK